MSSDIQISSTTPNYHPIFNEALKEYKRKTGNDLTTHPLAEEIKACDSPGTILSVLQEKANEIDQSGDERLTKWLTPTVNVLNALSATLGQGVGTVSPSMLPHQNSTYSYDDFQVFPPTKIIFSGIGILLVVSFLLRPTALAVITDNTASRRQAARDTAATRDTLIELFEKMKDFFVRLKTYTEVPSTPEMTNVMGKVMAEVLSLLAIATKEMKQGRTSAFISYTSLSSTYFRIEKFFKKLVGRTDIEDALHKMDKLEQGELHSVAAQVLKVTNDIKDGT